VIPSKKMHKTNLSFTHPESDWTSTHIDNNIFSNMKHSRPNCNHLSFATVESDFCAPYHGENVAFETSQTSPSHISFATPESDFVAIDYLGNVPRFITITEALAPSTEARVLTDADSFRIQHVNDAWTRLCGYSKEESHGKTLSILQGDATDKKAVKDVTHLLREGKSVEAVLTNYNKSGRKFHNHLTIEPVVCSQTNATTHFIGVLKEISGENNKQYAMYGI
jgi:PAS domain S-box-containing protein